MRPPESPQPLFSYLDDRFHGFAGKGAYSGSEAVF